MSTLFGVLVSEGELEQSREDAAREVRAQAVRVSYWTEYRTFQDRRLHVMNGSPDPVSEVDLLLSDTSDDSAHVRRLLTLAPCTEVTVKLGEGPLPSPPEFTDPLRGMFFRDRDGVHWRRDGGGLSRLPDDWDINSAGSGHEGLSISMDLDNATVRKAPACRDDA